MLRIIQELQEFGPIWNNYLETKQNEARYILAKETRVDSQEVHGKILMSGVRMKKSTRDKIEGSVRVGVDNTCVLLIQYKLYSY